MNSLFITDAPALIPQIQRHESVQDSLTLYLVVCLAVESAVTEASRPKKLCTAVALDVPRYVAKCDIRERRWQVMACHLLCWFLSFTEFYDFDLFHSSFIYSDVMSDVFCMLI